MVDPQGLYCISGFKRTGKDTLAKAINSFDGSFYITHFAAPLKEMAMRVFGLSRGQVQDEQLKEAPLERPIELDDYLVAMSEETGLKLKKAFKVANTPRQVLQFFGTDYVRASQDNYWMEQIHKRVSTHKRVLIADCRFLNEASFVKELGGHTIKVQRLDLPTDTDMHASEREIPLLNPDLLLCTLTGDYSIGLRVAKLIHLGRFQEALQYDYRRIEEALARYQAGESSGECLTVLGADPGDLEVLQFILGYYKVTRA